MTNKVWVPIVRLIWKQTRGGGGMGGDFFCVCFREKTKKNRAKVKVRIKLEKGEKRNSDQEKSVQEKSATRQASKD
jgi:hypothetical protein